ncbi:MAG TPA: universal stress protein [Candidatus Nitrosotalea sp.]|nr:universal stress protein [Candidatus Nitrosotalea sp.]
MMIKKILLPFDGSALSKKALELAKDIARNFNADLSLFMVIPIYYPISDSFFSGVSAANYRKMERVLQDEGKKKISKVVEKCRQEGVKAGFKIVSDDVSQAIMKEARRSRPDLIIMGSRRMTGISSIKRLGSTARYVSEHSTCPVTIVH